MVNTLTELPRDAEGRIKLPGLTRHSIEHDFAWQTAVPAGITVTAGTVATSGTPATGRGALELTTAADATPSVPRLASIELPQQADMQYADAVVWELHGLSLPGASAPEQMYIALESAGNIGAVFRKQESVIRSRSGSDVDLNAPISLQSQGRRTMTTLKLVIIPTGKIVALIEGDQVLTAARMSELAFGLLTPKLVIRTETAGAKNASVRKIVFTVHQSRYR